MQYYEDFCDRLALRKLLPKRDATCSEALRAKFADICGGYGRLADVYLDRYADVWFFDYAQNLLDQAKAAYGERLKIKQGTVYDLPFTDGEFDSLIFVRASHFMRDFGAALSETARVVKPGGRAVIEIANKKNAAEILRWCASRSKMHPFSLEPECNVAGFYQYHPRSVEKLFRQNNLKVKKVLGVRNIRSPLLKKLLGSTMSCNVERLTQEICGLFRFSPSIYYLLEKRLEHR
jgi:ubiquinone/menaquinone biosynthesis C-methylase UbiE